MKSLRYYLIMFILIVVQVYGQDSLNMSIQYYHTGFDEDIVETIDNYLFSTTDSSLSIYNIDNTILPVLITTLPCQGGVNDVAIYDTLLFIATGQEGMLIASINDPADPYLVNSPALPGLTTIHSIYIHENQLYLAAGSNGFRIYEIQSNNAVLHKYTYNLNDYSVFAAIATDTIAYVSGKYYRTDPYWELFDVSNINGISTINMGFTEYLSYPINDMSIINDCIIYQFEGRFLTKEISTFITTFPPLVGYPTNFAISNELIAVGDNDYGLSIYSISSNCSLSMTGSYRIFSSPKVAIQGSKVYTTITNTSGGRDLYIFEYSGQPASIKTPEINFVKKFQMSQNYPNPFNTSTNIVFDMLESGNVTIKLYSLSGALLSTLFKGYCQSGYNTIRFDGTGYASGIYFYQLSMENQTETQKISLLK